MPSPDARPLSARLDAYIANLTSIADQLVIVGTAALAADPSKAAAVEELTSSVKLYRTIADDLTKIVNGEKLPEFRVEGTLEGPAGA